MEETGRMLLEKNFFKETALKVQRVYKGRAIDLYNDKIRLPNKKSAHREYLSHPGAVGILAFLDSKRIVLVKQYRYPVAQATLELPAGKIDRGENPRDCVVRETQEEAGFTPHEIKKLVSFWPTPAFSNEVLHLYTATRLTPCPTNPDHDEFVEPVILDYKKALNLVKTGVIRDSKSVIALTFYEAFNKVKGRKRRG